MVPSYSGPEIRINTNRTFLSRALQLGFREIGIASVEAAPIVCRESHRLYAWQPLNEDAALEPADNVSSHRIKHCHQHHTIRSKLHRNHRGES